MTTILGFLSFALFIAFIVGLVKPALILRWTNKPTRLKVFGYWILANFLVGILAIAIESDKDKAESSIEADNNYIEQKSPKDENLSKLEIEASRLRAGGSVKTVELQGKSARIIYVKNYNEYKELNPQSGLTESDLEGYWESGDAIKKHLLTVL